MRAAIDCRTKSSFDLRRLGGVSPGLLVDSVLDRRLKPFDTSERCGIRKPKSLRNYPIDRRHEPLKACRTI